MTPVSEAVETYLYSVAALSGQTLRLYRRALHMFQDFCESQGLSLEQVTPKVFRAFAEALSLRISPRSKLPLESKTIQLYTRAVKIFISWVTEYDDYLGCVKPGSLRAMRVPRCEKKIMSVLDYEEIKLLYDACKKNERRYIIDRDKAILSVLLDSGLRASELCTLKLKDVHLQEMRIKVSGKGRKQREIPIGVKTRLDLHTFISRHRRGVRPDEYVFLSYKRNPLSQTTLDEIIERLKLLAGIEKEGGSHMFRRTYATLFMENGGDIYDLRDLMGHSHISTTEGYVQEANKRRIQQRSKSVLDLIR